MKENKTVLVAVIKNRRDLNMLLRKHIYRIPVLNAPGKKPNYIAFYQPAAFLKEGSRINYYAKVKNFSIVKRFRILPDEKNHLRSQADYYLVELNQIKILRPAIKNRSRMRVSFGFTSLGKLLKSKDIPELFDVPPMEEMVGNALIAGGIKPVSQYGLSAGSNKRYRMDFALFCRKGPLNIECDGSKWHSLKAQRIKDKKRDAVLEKSGWKILRFEEEEIVKDINGCVEKTQKAIKKLGGIIK